jgi:hypothetical protein
MVSAGNLMPRLGVSLALFVGTAVTVYAADRITPTCDPNRVPACWVEHGEGTGPQLVPVEPEQYDLPPPLPPPGPLVPPSPGHANGTPGSFAHPLPPSSLGPHRLPPSSLWPPQFIWSNGSR